MNTKTISLAGILTATLCLGGCASMFSAKQNTINVSSTVPNTSFYENGNLIGKGQFASFELPSGQTATITASKPGYMPQTTVTHRSFNKVSLWNIANFGGGFIVDAITGAIYTPTETQYILNPTAQAKVN